MRRIVEVLLIMFLSYTFINGQSDSIVKRFNPYKRMTEEGLLKDGMKQGEWKFYDSLNNLRLVQNYFNDTLNGKTIEFNNKGIIIKLGLYNKKSFRYKTTYYKEVESSATILEWYPVGEWLYYTDEGKLHKKEIYSSKGKLLKKLVYIKKKKAR
jgi:antitoxin component YwqK of YwqJK toxin-antitoxin module